MAFWARRMNQLQRNFLYFLDDNFFELDQGPLSGYYKKKAIRNSLRMSMMLATSVITQSQRLSTYLAALGIRVVEIPAHFDFTLISKSPTQIRSTETRNGEVRVGFAASPGRQEDLQPYVEILKKTLGNHPNLVLEFIGAIPDGLMTGAKVRFFPLEADYRKFLRLIESRNWDVGLAPLRPWKFNEYKTNNKYREYGALGIPGLYARMPPYSSYVRDGLTGLLESSAHEFGDLLELLVTDEGLRRSIGANAEAHIREEYSEDKVIPLWFRAFMDCAESNSAKVPRVYSSLRPSLLPHAYYLWSRLIEVYQLLRGLDSKSIVFILFALRPRVFFAVLASYSQGGLSAAKSKLLSLRLTYYEADNK